MQSTSTMVQHQQASESFTLSKDSEEALTELLLLLDYPVDKKGLCHGISKMSVQAFLSKELLLFCQRIEYITAQTDLVELARKIKAFRNMHKGTPSENIEQNLVGEENIILSDEDKEFMTKMDFEGFLDGITLSEFPSKYKEMLDVNHIQQTSDITSDLISSKKLEADGGFVQLDSWPGIYSESELLQYVNLLMLSAHKHDQDFALLLTSHNHTIGLCYDLDKNTWFITEASQLPALHFNYKMTITLTESLLASRIRDCFLPDDNEESQTESESEIEIEKDLQSEKTIVNSEEPLSDNQQEEDETEVNAEKEEENDQQSSSTESEAEIEKEEFVGFETIMCVAGSRIHLAAHMLKDMKSSQAFKDCHDIETRKHFKTIDGVTLAYLAAENNHPDIIRDLVSKGGDVNQLVTEAVSKSGNAVELTTGITPLWIAAFEGHVNIVVALCNHVDINQKCEGTTPLGIAAVNGHPDVIKILVDAGADINKGDQRFSPLWLAVCNRQSTAVKVLIECGANPETGYQFSRDELLKFAQDNGVNLQKLDTLITLKSGLLAFLPDKQFFITLSELALLIDFDFAANKNTAYQKKKPKQKWNEFHEDAQPKEKKPKMKDIQAENKSYSSNSFYKPNTRQFSQQKEGEKNPFSFRKT